MSHSRRQLRDQAWDHFPGAVPMLGSWEVQVTKGAVRVGDAERDAAAQALGEHFAGGRLDREEYDERIDAVLAAKTRGELARVFRDLPSAAPFIARAPRRPPRQASGFRLPLVPVVLILVGIAILAHAQWVFWIGLGAVLLARRATRTHRPPDVRA